MAECRLLAIHQDAKRAAGRDVGTAGGSGEDARVIGGVLRHDDLCWWLRDFSDFRVCACWFLCACTLFPAFSILICLCYHTVLEEWPPIRCQLLYLGLGLSPSYPRRGGAQLQLLPQNRIGEGLTVT